MNLHQIQYDDLGNRGYNIATYLADTSVSIRKKTDLFVQLVSNKPENFITKDEFFTIFLL